jgi:hypothetical protein
VKRVAGKIVLVTGAARGQGDDRREVGERPPGRARPALNRVSKQYHGRPRVQARAPAHRTPVQDHEVARRHLGHTLAHRLHDPGDLVPEHERELVVDLALAVRVGEMRRAVWAALWVAVEWKAAVLMPRRHARHCWLPTGLVRDIPLGCGREALGGLVVRGEYKLLQGVS